MKGAIPGFADRLAGTMRPDDFGPVNHLHSVTDPPRPAETISHRVAVREASAVSRI
jgi:hypothetical protein